MENLICELINEQKKTNEMLESILNKKHMPTLLYVKDIVQNYRVATNKATELCKKYGTNFGGWCIESEVLTDVLKTAGHELLELNKR